MIIKVQALLIVKPIGKKIISSVLNRRQTFCPKILLPKFYTKLDLTQVLGMETSACGLYST